MATIPILVSQGKLIPLDADLDHGHQVERCLYLLPKAAKWLEDKLPELKPEWKSDLSPLEQADAFFEFFASGGNLAVGPQFHHMEPGEQGIWELKTPDLRFFGWFVARDCFIISACNQKSAILAVDGLYAGYRNQAVADRNRLNLDEKFLSGIDPYAVVSNYHIPFT